MIIKFISDKEWPTYFRKKKKRFVPGELINVSAQEAQRLLSHKELFAMPGQTEEKKDIIKNRSIETKKNMRRKEETI